MEPMLLYNLKAGMASQLTGKIPHAVKPALS